MRKEETLRGRGSFASVLESGERIEGELLRCFFSVDRGAGTRVRAGFSVSRKVGGAVTRNRVKRLMRAAFDAERDRLRASPGSSALTIVFVYKGRKDIQAGRLRLTRLQGDMTLLCRRCASSMSTMTT